MVGLPMRKAATSAARGIGSTAGSALASRNAINWDNYNYPPLLHVVHFDLEELDAVPRLIVRWCHWSYKLLVVCLFTNFVTNLVLAIGAVKLKYLHAVYAFFNLVIGTTVGFYVFFSGYKGVAIASSSMMHRYMALEAAIIVLEFCFSILSVANFNGWTRVDQIDGAPTKELKLYWLAAAFIESILWTIAYVIGCVALYHVVVLDRSGPMAFSGTRRAVKALRETAMRPAQEGVALERL
mmetsp:Transcript_18852/g.48589  ORF Transcript_18852/g.48589 Transcript_18852/m.48589 type:complete len:239 (+) Transcript_18852:71-787(+)|eukprot:CAMPEP_0119410342 /NCGR_PEP_ID=MMETSP1335-20130426/3393_1 /TAXON_ID=259385 /ORGANISM="Chrysoculter rhomboideus, Strain RCC1486" /LENGTH=238 /DNA_ID=CAMNT_0007434849 /DNA_START=60 /DNA_END=776 /DNA_ORIENTATION=-